MANEILRICEDKCVCGKKACSTCRSCHEPVCFDHSVYHEAWETLCRPCYEKRYDERGVRRVH